MSFSIWQEGRSPQDSVGATPGHFYTILLHSSIQAGRKERESLCHWSLSLGHLQVCHSPILSDCPPMSVSHPHALGCSWGKAGALGTWNCDAPKDQGAETDWEIERDAEAQLKGQRLM